jgi:hypothetical protein
VQLTRVVAAVEAVQASLDVQCHPHTAWIPRRSCRSNQSSRFIDFFARTLLTLLGEILSDFDEVHALLSSVDLLDERLQITRAEHVDDTRSLLIFGKKSSSLVELDLFDGDLNFPRNSKVVTNLKSKTTCWRTIERFD